MIVSIILDNPWLGLFEVSPLRHKIISFLFNFFIGYGGARYAAAVLIWIVVTFRREDWTNLLGRKETVPADRKG